MVAVLLALLLVPTLYGNPTNAPADRPCSQCHTGTPDNPGRILIEFSAFQYTPGVQQTVKVHILQDRLPGATNFQMTARLASNELAPAGSFASSSTTQILTQNGLPYVTNNGLNGTTVYTFAWTPPGTNVGNVRFFVSAVGGGLDGVPGGNAFTASYVMAPASLDLPAGYRRQPLTIPGATWVEPHWVSSNGSVSGKYRIGSSEFRGFVRNQSGSLTTFDAPGSLETVVVNSAGTVAGSYFLNNQRRGFVRAANGTITLFDVPGATSTALTGINDSGTVVGMFTDASNATHALEFTAPPAFRFFDVSTSFTEIGGVSNSGLISGTISRTGFVLVDDTAVGYITCGTELNGGSAVAAVNDSRYAAGVCRGRVGSLLSNDSFLQSPIGRRIFFPTGTTIRGINNILQTTISENTETSFLLTPCEASPAPTFTIITAPAAGGTTSIPLTTAPDCIVNAISESPWITVNPHVAGSGNLVVNVQPNPGPSRTGSVWVAGTSVAIQQPAADCTFQVAGGPSTFGSQGGNGTLTIAAPAGCTWTATPSATWIVPASTTGAGNLNFTVQPNNGTQTRTATIQIGTTVFTINQAGAPGCTYQLFTLTATNTVSIGGGGVSIGVNTGAGCQWNVQTGASWITFTNGSGTGPGTFTANVAANNTSASRLATLTAGDATITLQQPAAQTQLSGLRFIPIAPCRLADTRDTTRLAKGETRNFPALSPTCNIPPAARAYSLNVTVVPDGYLGYLTVYPAGQIRPPVSTLNSWNGRVVANAAIVEAGNNGDISVYADDPTHVILDINGYFVAPTVPNGLSFYPVAPCRIADTRPQANIGSMQHTFAVRGLCDVPANALAYSFNLTVIPSRTLAFATIYPTGVPRPNASTLNSFDGQVVPNAALVPAGIDGQVTVFGTDVHDVVLDINGYFAPPGQANGLAYGTVLPCRLADTRFTSELPGGSTRTFAVIENNCGIPSNARAFVLNTTAVPPGYLGYVSFWPAGLPQPLVSTLNSFNGQVVANMAIVPNGIGGAVNAFASNATQLILDTSGYFAPDSGN